MVPFGEGVGFPSEPSPRHRLEHQRDTINTISLKKPFGRGTKCNGRVGKRKKIGGMTEDQVSSGEFADLRPNPKVYLDSNIVSVIAKDDIPTESEALNRLLQV